MFFNNKSNNVNTPLLFDIGRCCVNKTLLGLVVSFIAAAYETMIHFDPRIIISYKNETDEQLIIRTVFSTRSTVGRHLTTCIKGIVVANVDRYNT